MIATPGRRAEPGVELLAELAVVVRDFGQLLRVEVEGVPSQEAARLNAAPGSAAAGR